MRKLFVKSRRNSLLIMGLFLTTFAAQAKEKDTVGKPDIAGVNQNQEKIIRGNIKDESGLDLIGVSIVAKGTTVGTASDFEGNFELRVPNNGTIVITYVGFVPQEIKIGNQTSFNIVMKEDAKTLEEVVVVGYTTQKKADLTGAVASVKMDNLHDMTTSSVTSALQGRMSGVTVMQSSGAPGSGTSVRIRGMGTFGNNEPLYVIDGMFSDNMNDINPADIERIDVLKDASSAAIYGSRAANGVVIIKTKKGSQSGKVDISFNTSHGFAMAQKKIKVLNAEQRNMIHSEAINASYAAGKIDKDAYEEQMAYYSDPYSKVTRTNWQDEVFSDGAYQANYDLSVTGGNEKISFNIGGGHLDQDGILKGTGFNRTTFRINTEVELIKGLKFGENLTITNSTRKDVSEMGRSGAIGSALLFDPSVPVWEDEANGIYSGSGELGADIRNPMTVVDRADRKDMRDRIFGNVYASYKIFNDFTLRTDFGYDWTSSHNKWFNCKVPEAGVANNTNELTEIKHKSRRWTNTNTIQYDKTFGLNKLMLMGGTAYEEYLDDWTDVRGTGFFSEDPKQRYMEAATRMAWSTGNRDEYALQSYLARADYSFADRYLLSASFRADGSSKFQKKNRWGYFPSVSGGWRISEESFFEPLKERAIQSLKVRASWGQLGNQDISGSASPYYPTYTKVSNTTDNDGYNVVFGDNSPVFGRYEATLPNKDIKWEVSTQTDIGLDINFLDHFDLGFDYFIKKSKDVLVEIPIPALAGIKNGKKLMNAADVENKGIEISLAYNTSISKDFHINAYGNFSNVKNKVTAMGTGSASTPKSAYRGTNITYITEGQPIGHFYGYKTDGIFRSQEEVDNYVNSKGEKIQPKAGVGDFRFVDLDGNGTINGNDQGNIGSGFPDYTFGFGSDITFKSFDLSFFFQGVMGYDIFNALKYEGMFVDNRYNQFAAVLDRYHPVNNPNGNGPRVMTIGDNDNRRMSDYYVDKGDYLRLKTLTVGYTLDKKLSEKLRLKKARVYVTMQNLLTFTGYKGFDPDLGETYANETGSLKATNEIGVDRGQFPQPRTFVMGVNINF